VSHSRHILAPGRIPSPAKACRGSSAEYNQDLALAFAGTIRLDVRQGGLAGLPR
jgi:hypothetical protein